MENDYSDMITRAFDSLIIDIDESSHNNNEKEALKLFIYKLDLYYKTRMELFVNDNKHFKKRVKLESLMTEILVEISHILNTNTDVFYFISVMNNKLKELNIDKILEKSKLR